MILLVKMFKVNTILKLALVLMIMVIPCIVQGATPKKTDLYSFLPVHGKNAEPTARVFGDRLYVYTSTDHTFACGPKGSKTLKMQGYRSSCNPAFSVFSTNDSTLQGNWTEHKNILTEADVPWVFKPEGFSGSARMWAPDAVQGDDGLYYLIFSAPKEAGIKQVIGLAVSEKPEGPFKARPEPITGTDGIDPSLVKLSNGKWVLFSAFGSDGISWQYIDSNFTVAQKKVSIGGQNLMPNRVAFVEAPFAEIRSGNLYFYYAATYGNEGYRIRQARAFSPADPSEGFKDIGVVINHFDPLGRENQGSVVTYKGRSWAFYHRHTAGFNERWSARKAVFSPIDFTCDGRQNVIFPPAIPDPFKKEYPVRCK